MTETKVITILSSDFRADMIENRGIYKHSFLRCHLRQGGVKLVENICFNPAKNILHLHYHSDTASCSFLAQARSHLFLIFISYGK